MAEVSSLEAIISADAKPAINALDDIIQKLDSVIGRLSSLGQNKGFDNFSQNIKYASETINSISGKIKEATSGIGPQMQEAFKPLEQITAQYEEQYKDLGKGFELKGSTAYIQKQIDNLSNSLSKANLKKQELETSGKTEGQMYEYAVRDVKKLSNQIESLENQLAKIKSEQPKFDFDISGIEEARQAIESTGESIRESVTLPESAFNYNAEAMSAVFGEAAANIQNFSQAVEQFGARAGQVINESTQLDFNMSGIENNSDAMQTVFEEAAAGIRNCTESIEQLGERAGQALSEFGQHDFNISGINEAAQDFEGFSGQIENTKNLLIKTFSDLKSGDIWQYLSTSISAYVNAAQAAAGIKIYTEDYKNVLSDIERTEGALEKLGQKQRDLQAAGTDEESQEWQKLAAGISAAESRLDSYLGKKNQMESSGAGFQFSGGLANQSALKNMGAVAGEAMASLRQKIGEISSTVSQAVGNIPVIGRVAKESAFLGKTAFNGMKTAMASIAPIAGKAAGAMSVAASGIKKLVSSVKGAILKFSSLAKSMIGIKGASGGMNMSLSGGLKSLLKYVPGIQAISSLFKKLGAAAKESFKNLAQYSSETNTSLSMLQSSLGAMKNSFSVAFAPIVNVAAPYLSMLIDLLTQAFNKVGQFFAALTGNSFAAQSKKNFSDYAAGVSEAGGAAKKAGKDAKGALRPFDELKTISLSKGEDSGGGIGEISPADMFETVPIESNISDFAQKIKDSFANADFTEIGTILGTKVKDVLDSIKWEPIQEMAAKAGESIGTLINGLVEAPGLAGAIGQTIGEAINTGITGINSFLDNTHWDSVGAFIGEGLNGLVDTIDWAGLGHLFAEKWNALFEVIGEAARTFDWIDFGMKLADGVNTAIADFDWAENGARLSDFVKGALDTLITFLENTNWQELGNNVADFIGSVDWGGIMEKLAEGIGAVLGGLAAFLWGLIEDAWGNVVEWWHDVAFEDGQFTIEGLFKGILDVLKNVGTWIKEHIFQPFIDGFAKAFGIHSPSKVMAEQGKYIISGLLRGLVDNIASVWEWVKGIPDKLTGFFKDLPNSFLQIGGNIISGLWDGIKNTWDNLSSGLKDIGSGIVNTFKSVLDIHSPSRVMFELGDYTMQGFQDGLENLYKPILSSVETFGKDLQLAPAPSLTDVYGNYTYAAASYATQHSSGSRDSEIIGAIERIAYTAIYNATSSAINNSKLLNDMLDEVEKGQTINLDGTPLYKNMVKRATDDMRSGKNNRLIIAEELYV